MNSLSQSISLATQSETIAACLTLCGYQTADDYRSLNDKAFHSIERYIANICQTMPKCTRTKYMEEAFIDHPKLFTISPAVKSRLLAFLNKMFSAGDFKTFIDCNTKQNQSLSSSRSDFSITEQNVSSPNIHYSKSTNNASPTNIHYSTPRKNESTKNITYPTTKKNTSSKKTHFQSPRQNLSQSNIHYSSSVNNSPSKQTSHNIVSTENKNSKSPSSNLRSHSEMKDSPQTFSSLFSTENGSPKAKVKNVTIDDEISIIDNRNCYLADDFVHNSVVTKVGKYLIRDTLDKNVDFDFYRYNNDTKLGFFHCKLCLNRKTEIKAALSDKGRVVIHDIVKHLKDHFGNDMIDLNKPTLPKNSAKKKIQSKISANTKINRMSLGLGRIVDGTRRRSDINYAS